MVYAKFRGQTECIMGNWKIENEAPCKRTQHCWPTTPNNVGSHMLRPFAHPVACCWILLRVVAQSLKPVKLFSQQLPTFLLFRDRQSVAQQCWIRLHSSSNIVGAAHAHYACITGIKLSGYKPVSSKVQAFLLLFFFSVRARQNGQHGPYLIHRLCFILHFVLFENMGEQGSGNLRLHGPRRP